MSQVHSKHRGESGPRVELDARPESHPLNAADGSGPAAGARQLDEAALAADTFPFEAGANGTNDARPAPPAGPRFPQAIPTPGQLTHPLSAASLMRDVTTLCTRFAGRAFGTQTNRDCAQFLAERFQALGLTPPPGAPGFRQPFVTLAGERRLLGCNVVAAVQGTDPALQDEVVVLSAHFDTVQSTQQGAHDNATGCAAVLATAALMAADPPRRTVLFVIYDGEESYFPGDGKRIPGRRGSRHYASEPLYPVERTAFQVNVDMLGLPHLESGDFSEFYGWNTPEPFAREVMGQATRGVQGPKVQGYPECTPDQQWFTTDAEYLWELGVPSINLLSGRDARNHQEGDTMDKLVPARLEMYSTVTAEATLAAANESRSIAELGVAPGRTRPEQYLIGFRENHRRSAVPKGLLPRPELPEFGVIRAICDDLVQRLKSPILQGALGVEWKDLARVGQPLVSKETLAALRELRELVTADYRELDKNDVEARVELVGGRLARLSAVEKILDAAVFFSAIVGEPTGSFAARLPAQTRKLLEGAEALGLNATVSRHLDEGDLAQALTVSEAVVSVEKALELGAAPLSDLVQPFLQAGQALIFGTNHGRELSAADRNRLVRGVAELALQRNPMAQRKLEAASAIRTWFEFIRIRGDDSHKWLGKFADKHGPLIGDWLGLAQYVMDDTEALSRVGALELAARAFARLPGDHPDKDKTEVTFRDELLSFTNTVAQRAFGGRPPFDSLDALMRLDGASLDRWVGNLKDELARASRLPADAPELVDARAKVGLIDPFLAFQRQLTELRFAPAAKKLKGSADALEQLAAALDGVPGAAGICAEARYWAAHALRTLAVSELPARAAAARRALLVETSRTLRQLGADVIAAQTPDLAGRDPMEVMHELRRTEEAPQVREWLEASFAVYLALTRWVERPEEGTLPALQAAVSELRWLAELGGGPGEGWRQPMATLDAAVARAEKLGKAHLVVVSDGMAADGGRQGPVRMRPAA